MSDEDLREYLWGNRVIRDALAELLHVPRERCDLLARSIQAHLANHDPVLTITTIDRLYPKENP